MIISKIKKLYGWTYKNKEICNIIYKKKEKENKIKNFIK